MGYTLDEVVVYVWEHYGALIREEASEEQILQESLAL